MIISIINSMKNYIKTIKNNQMKIKNDITIIKNYTGRKNSRLEEGEV